MNMRVLLGRLAPFTVAVGRTVCLFMDFMWARKLRLGSQAQIENPYKYYYYTLIWSSAGFFPNHDLGSHDRSNQPRTERRPSEETARRRPTQTHIDNTLPDDARETERERRVRAGSRKLRAKMTTRTA